MQSRNISRHLQTDYGLSLAGKKRKILTDIRASRLEQMVFDDENPEHAGHEDQAEREIMAMQLESRQRRDLALDHFNPRQELPRDITAERIVDQIPDFKPKVLELSLPGDDKARDQVQLVQDGRYNYIRQSTMYDNPEFHSSGEGRGDKGVPPNVGYSLGGTGGLHTNTLDDRAEKNGIPDNVASF